MSKGRELLVGFVIIAAVAVGVVGTLWLKGVRWGRPLDAASDPGFGRGAAHPR